ncbi:hypothetical protein MYAM1_002956 [Malassezia yamatoensis]|uniref:Uncharacterized protein n=1 Tax=Malassezia yamatoensis TaxID=253288 RepID=A0AAJ5YZ29_9BASI|nr:hypothetical protein MYAM1_002956 [Malassezia yamatoensis]
MVFTGLGLLSAGQVYGNDPAESTSSSQLDVNHRNTEHRNVGRYDDQWVSQVHRVVRRHRNHYPRALTRTFPGADIASSLYGGEFYTLPAGQYSESSSNRRTQGSDSTATTQSRAQPSSSSGNGGSNANSATTSNGQAGSGTQARSNTQDRTRSSAASATSSSTRAASTAGAGNTQNRSSSSSSSSPSSSGNAGAAPSSASQATRTRGNTAAASSRTRTATTVMTSTDSSPPASSDTVVTSQVSVTGQPTSTGSPNQHKDNHTGLIAGVSTAGGVVLLAILGIIFGKLFGRRIVRHFRNDEIKWPEMQQESAAANAPLPARQTGGAGFDMGNESDDEHREQPMQEVSMKYAEPLGSESLLQGSAPMHQPVTYPVSDIGTDAPAVRELYPTPQQQMAPPTTQSNGLVSHVPVTDGVPVPQTAGNLEAGGYHNMDSVQQRASGNMPQQYLENERHSMFDTHSQATDQNGYSVSAIADAYGDAYGDTPAYTESDMQYHQPANAYDETAFSPYETDAYVGQMHGQYQAPQDTRYH